MDHLDRLQQPTHERAPPPAPPGPLCFLVFVFPRPPAASGPPGRPLTVESKTLRPASADGPSCFSPRQFCAPLGSSIGTTAGILPASLLRLEMGVDTQTQPV